MTETPTPRVWPEPPNAPEPGTRFRDRDGDIWRMLDGKMAVCEVEHGTPIPFEQAMSVWGPLMEILDGKK